MDRKARLTRTLIALLLLCTASAAPVSLSRQRFEGDTRIATLSGSDTDAVRTLDGYITAASALDVEMWVFENPGRHIELRLAGPGGSTTAGTYVMAMMADADDATTSVAPGRECLSACAIAWLGGRTRVAPTGLTRLGFHSARCVVAPCEGATVAEANATLDEALAEREPALHRQLASRDYLADPATMTYAASAGPTWVAWTNE